MKKTLLLLAAVCSLNLAVAQNEKAVQTQKATKAEMMASRHTKHLQNMLTLTEEQTTKTHDALLARFTEAQAIREKAGANPDKQALKTQFKSVREKYVTAMNTILTADQKTKWNEQRQRVKNGAPNNAASNLPNAPKKTEVAPLTNEDDGIESN